MPKTRQVTLERRVLAVLPHWREWPRELRRVYLLQESHGVGEAGLVSIAEDLGLEVGGLKERIAAVPTFREALEAYWATGEYPRLQGGGRNRAWRISYAMLLRLYVRESATVGLFQSEMQLRDGKPSSAAVAQVYSEVKELFEQDGQLQKHAVREGHRAQIAQRYREQLPTFERVEIPLEDEEEDEGD